MSLHEDVAKHGTIVFAIPDGRSRDGHVVMVKRHEPVWADYPYVVWNHTCGIGLFQGHYELDFKEAVRVLLSHLDN